MSENIASPNISESDLARGDSSFPTGSVPQVDPLLMAPKKPSILAIIALVILSVIAVLSIYLFLQVRQLALEKTAPPPTPTPTASADPIANWQRFTHPTQGYSLQYPADINVLIDESTGANSVFLPSDDPYNIIGGVEVRELKIKPEEWIASEKKSGVELFEQNIHTTPFTEGVKIKASKAMDYYAYIFSREDMLYIVSLMITGQDDERLFDQILSTFKFMDCTKNDSLNMTIDLPEQWECGTVYDGDSIGSLDLSYGDLSVSISDGGRGPYCGDGPDPDNLCKTRMLVLSDKFKFTTFNYKGEDKEIFGGLGKTSRDTNRWISVRYKDMETKELTNIQKQALLELLNSIGFTN